MHDDWTDDFAPVTRGQYIPTCVTFHATSLVTSARFGPNSEFHVTVMDRRQLAISATLQAIGITTDSGAMIASPV